VRDELERVLRALQELPEVVRSAVLLRGEANLSYEDIASALGVSPGAARVMVHRARAKLAAEREESEG
jgi:RNA polymerase sigma-70 factor (ECF subfamily)